ncbi:hypothetical protein [Aeromonas veronii]|uniref:hypothetical protein n=1 Tax=Aeromonas TaxID=642 RepID=UPI0032EF86F9
MNLFLRGLYIAFYSIIPMYTYAYSTCDDDVSYYITTKTSDDEPSSTLSIMHSGEGRTFTVPFSSGNISCKKINTNGLIKITVPADRPRLSAIYYFDVSGKFNYIGGASISISSGEERVSGIGEINKGNEISAVDLDGVASEDAAIISKIISTSYSLASNDKVSDLYHDMRYIEINALSEYTGNKICGSDESVFYYCKTKSGKNLNLCYSPFSGDITYNYGKQRKELSLNDFSLMGETFSFKNKNTMYNVSPAKGEISVIQNGKQLSVISCT